MQDPSRPVTGYPAPNGCPPPQPGTAYAYPAPPPPQRQPPYYYNNNNNNNPYSYRSPSFLRRFLAAMVVFFIIGGVIIFVLWLVLRPRIPEFQVDSLSLSNFSLSNSSSSITGNWNVRFSVTNPNQKLSLAYDDVSSFIYYKSDPISQTRIPPFKQQKRNRTVVDAAFSTTDSYVDTWVANGINGDRARGTVNFNVRVLARVVFRAGGWRARNRILRVFCDDVPVGVSANRTGNLVGGPRECAVGL